MADQIRVYHWVITLQWRTPTGTTGMHSQEGLYGARPGETAQEIYRAVHSEITRAHGVPSSASVLCWSLTPNTL